jgi:hypothetical protein
VLPDALKKPTKRAGSKAVTSAPPKAGIISEAYPADTTAMLIKLQREYAKTSNPIAVSFRDLVPWVRGGERATHYLHSYPAKLLPQIAHFFLAARGWLSSSDVVLDPFAGTGTVALEANLSGRKALYADVNPLARLITSAKTIPISLPDATALLTEIKDQYDAIHEAPVPWVVNVDLWYPPAAKFNLARLRQAILQVDTGVANDFVWATFSATARKCSRASSRFAVPVRVKAIEKRSARRSVWTVFKLQYESNLKRQRDLQRISRVREPSQCAGADARHLQRPVNRVASKPAPLPKNSVGLVLTSPPYAGAQKYVRASSLSLGWLGLTNATTLKRLENASIGREHFRKASLKTMPSTGIDDADKLIGTLHQINPIRAAICAHYLREMDQAIREIARVLKPGGKAVVVIGDNTVCGMPFTSTAFLTELFKRRGMALTLALVDQIRSRGLLTKRSGGAVAIQSETILVFER